MSKASMEERMKKLRELAAKRHEGRKANMAEVAEEDRRAKLPANFEAKQARLEEKLDYERSVADCEARGADPKREHALDMRADEDATTHVRKQRKAANIASASQFSTYEDVTRSQYDKLVRNMKTDSAEYEREKEKMGDRFYPTLNTLGVNERKDNPEAVERLKTEIDKQVAKRARFSRRRPFDADSDIDYINDKNRLFNKKLDRFYGQYTAEIKQNLERGTAI